MSTRHAVVEGQAARIETIRRYMPSNYSAEVSGDDVLISGEDKAGWTLDGYVIERLASGLYFAKEIFPDRSETALRARAQRLIPDTIEGTDLITVEVGGQDDDLILTPEYAAYLHWKLALILGLPCEEQV